VSSHRRYGKRFGTNRPSSRKGPVIVAQPYAVMHGRSRIERQCSAYNANIKRYGGKKVAMPSFSFDKEPPEEGDEK